MDSKQIRKLKDHLSKYFPLYILFFGYVIASIFFFIEMSKYV
jgi:hypothetical protein